VGKSPQGKKNAQKPKGKHEEKKSKSTEKNGETQAQKGRSKKRGPKRETHNPKREVLGQMGRKIPQKDLPPVWVHRILEKDPKDRHPKKR